MPENILWEEVQGLGWEVTPFYFGSKENGLRIQEKPLSGIARKRVRQVIWLHLICWGSGLVCLPLCLSGQEKEDCGEKGRGRAGLAKMCELLMNLVDSAEVVRFQLSYQKCSKEGRLPGYGRTAGCRTERWGKKVIQTQILFQGILCRALVSVHMWPMCESEFGHLTSREEKQHLSGPAHSIGNLQAVTWSHSGKYRTFETSQDSSTCPNNEYIWT